MSSNNSIIVQIRRGTTAQTAAFTGALAELTVDTDQNTIVVHDGVTPGGTTLSTKAFTQAAFDAANTLSSGSAIDNVARLSAQAAFDAANAATQNVSLTYSSTIGGIPNTDTLVLGEPSININDGRMFIRLGDGKIVDISSTPVGNTFYVSMNGNDNYSGDTPSSAKASIKAAVAIANPGDTVVVSSGVYNEITPIIIPQQVQIEGSGERNCIIKPQTPSNDIFWVNNNSYVTGFKFIDYTGSAIAFPGTEIETGVAVSSSANTITLDANAETYDNYYDSMVITITDGTGSGQSVNIVAYDGTTKVATVGSNWSTQPDNTSSYSLKIPLRTTPALANSRYSTFITGSPYIYNSSSITTTGTGLKVDGDLATGNKSIISAQFTQVNSGGKGVHVLNDGYTQLVSIYGIFCDTAFLAESGGTASMGNCNVNFGNKGLVANGKGKLAMTASFNDNSVAATSTISLNTVVANNSLGVTASVPYTGLIMKIDGDNPENYYIVTGATPLDSGNTIVTFQSTIANSWPSGTSVSFYQQSQLRASGQTFEFVGGGTNISALPRSGGVANTEAQTITIGEGAVYATSTDQSGNFTVSDLTINQSTSTITGRTFAKSLFAEMTPYILALEG